MFQTGVKFPASPAVWLEWSKKVGVVPSVAHADPDTLDGRQAGPGQPTNRHLAAVNHLACNRFSNERSNSLVAYGRARPVAARADVAVLLGLEISVERVVDDADLG